MGFGTRDAHVAREKEVDCGTGAELRANGTASTMEQNVTPAACEKYSCTAQYLLKVAGADGAKRGQLGRLDCPRRWSLVAGRW